MAMYIVVCSVPVMTSDWPERSTRNAKLIGVIAIIGFDKRDKLRDVKDTMIVFIVSRINR